MTPHRIVLISHGRYEEADATADCYPGQLLERGSTGVAPHSVAGGKGPIRVCQEDALQGKTITDKIASGQLCPHRMGISGDVLLMLLAIGQNVARGAKLMSAGDGTLTAAINAELANVVADSNNVTNTTVETTFSNGTVTIPAKTLKADDKVKIKGTAMVTAQNSTNTHQVKVKLGSDTIADSAAANLAANGIISWDLELIVRTAGNSGTYIVTGEVQAGATTIPVNLASTAINTNAVQTLTVTTTASAASTGNVIKMSSLHIDLERDEGVNALVQAEEAVDNSAGTAAAFIRALVI